jgi:hypothetical protein
VLRGRWCDIIALNVHELCDDSDESICEESEHVFYHFPKYHMTILFGDVNIKLGSEHIFKPKIENGTVTKNTKDNGIRDANFVNQKT